MHKRYEEFGNYTERFLPLQYGFEKHSNDYYFMYIQEHKAKTFTLSLQSLLALYNIVHSPFTCGKSNIRMDARYFPLIHKDYFKYHIINDNDDTSKKIVDYLYEIVSMNQLPNIYDLKFSDKDIAIFLKKHMCNYVRCISNAIDEINLNLNELIEYLQSNNKNIINDLNFCTYIILLPARLNYELDKVFAIYKSNLVMSTLAKFINNEEYEFLRIDLETCINALNSKLYYKVINSEWFEAHCKAIITIENIYKEFFANNKKEIAKNGYYGLKLAECDLSPLLATNIISKELLTSGKKSYKNNAWDFCNKIFKINIYMINRLDSISFFEFYGYVHFLTLLHRIDMKYNSNECTKGKLLTKLFGRGGFSIVKPILGIDYKNVFDDKKAIKISNITGDYLMYTYLDKYKSSHFFGRVKKHISELENEKLPPDDIDTRHNFRTFVDFKGIHALCLNNVFFYLLIISCMK